MIRENNIFIVGIKGVAMANLAVILKRMGKSVIGSDVAEEFITDDLLKKNHISCTIGFSPDVLPKETELIIYSAAHQGRENPQVKEGEKRGIKIRSQTEILGEITKDFKTTIAICGSHGKTTTSSLLAYSLKKLGVKPSYLVGSPSFNNYQGSDYQSGILRNYFVIEADEYGVDPPRNKTPKFFFLNPNYIICTNIDFDHPDVYQNITQVKEAFLKFFNKKNLILCVDDPILFQLINNQLKKNKIQTYGFKKEADLVIKNWISDEKGSKFSLVYHGKQLGELTISLFGKKNVSNAAGVVLTLIILGFSFEKIKKAIAGFIGAKRRFEKIAFINDTYLFDDYGHHPKEIETTIKAAQDRFNHRRIIVVFQPHTYSRTQAFVEEFGKSLSLANFSFILPIFPSARENKKQFKINAEDIVKASKKDNLFSVEKNELISQLKKILKKGDVIFTMGAGDVYRLKNDIINIIKQIT